MGEAMTEDILIVAHCWRYARLAAYQLSSLILHPPKCNVREIVFIIDNQAAVKQQGLRVVLRVERAENIDRAGETGLSQLAGFMQGMYAEPVRSRVDKDAPGFA